MSGIPRICVIALAILVLPMTIAAAAAPNMLLVIGDDMTWTDCRPYGSEQVQTPNLTRLAAEGMTLDRCFTATAMCAPTRQQLYTGLFPVRSGAYPNHSRVLDGTRSAAHHFQRLGYRVGLIGKRHINPPESYPFEYLRGKGGADDVAAIRQFVLRDPQQPYLLIVASNEPHTPWNRGDVDLYPPDELTVPPYLVDTPETRAGLSKYFAEISYLDRQLGACMRVVDRSPGADNTMVIFTSEQGSSFPFGGKWTCYDTGLKTATVVRWPGVIEPGSRSEAMVQYVDILPTLIEAAGGDPRKIDTGRSGAPDGGNGFDGRSFLAVLKGKATEHRQYVFGAHTTRGIINGSDCYPIRSVRGKRFKYIRNLASDTVFTNILTGDGRDTVLASWRAAGDKAAARARFYQHRPAEELYDLDTDPWELTNRAADPALAKVKAELAAQLDAWMQQQNDEGVATELKANQRQRRQKK